MAAGFLVMWISGGSAVAGGISGRRWGDSAVHLGRNDHRDFDELRGWMAACC